jgi:hypothetical protein
MIMAKEGEKYMVVKAMGIYLLQETPENFRIDDYPSCSWIGDNPKEGQKIEDEDNARLVREGRATAERVKALRGCRVKDGL